jgi:hypothetical protein
MLIYHPILSFMHFFDTRKSGKLMKHSKVARGLKVTLKQLFNEQARSTKN